MRGFRGWAVLFCLMTGSVRGDAIADLVRIHREAIGGAQLEEWPALEASGVVRMGGKELKFSMVAARPNRVRLTLRGENRTLVQATDGVSAPWQADSLKAPTTELLSADDGRAFMADAEFDDPLVSRPERGYRLDYAGETEWAGARVLRVLVTRGDSAPYFLLLDPDTYFIQARLVTQRQPSGREVTVETVYDDFRPVGGVILAHRITTRREGRVMQEMVLTEVRASVETPLEVFTRPFLGGAAVAEARAPRGR